MASGRPRRRSGAAEAEMVQDWLGRDPRRTAQEVSVLVALAIAVAVVLTIVLLWP